MDQRSRHDVLRDLVQIRGDLHALMAELRRFSWDYPAELVELTTAAAGGVLRRYLAGELSAADCEAWANALEGRDDVRFGAGAGVCSLTSCSSWRIPP